MRIPAFKATIDFASTKLAAPRDVGSTTITVVDGTVFGSPSPTNPVRVTLERAKDGAATHLIATARNGNSLTASAEPGFPDLSFATGDSAGVTASLAAVRDLSAPLADLIQEHNTLMDSVSSLATTTGGSVTKSANLSDLASPATARANLGLGSVNNTSDSNKPISTATQTALDLKAPLTSPSFTGQPTAPTAPAGTNTTQVATTAFVASAVASSGGAVTSVAGKTGAVTLAPSDVVGLGTAAISAASDFVRAAIYPSDLAELRRLASIASLAYSPASVPGLLAEYDFLQGASASILYDKSANAAHGTVGSGASFGPLGLTTPQAVATTGWATSGVPGNAVKTVIVAFSPTGQAPVFASSTATGTQTPLFADLVGTLPVGDLLPRVRDMNSGAIITARQNAPSWPCVLGYTLGNPGRQYLNGVPATMYDGQSNGSDFNPGTTPISFGNNFVSNSSGSCMFCYALLYSGVLSPEQMAGVSAYIAAKLNFRAYPPAGPVAMTQDLLVLTGNSITNMMDLAQVKPTVNFAKAKIGFGGASPSQVVQLSRQATQPLFRPSASRNYLMLWPTPNISTVSDIPNYIVPYAREMRARGWKVAVPTAISASGFDPLKNQINATYDALMASANPPFDKLIDLRPVAAVSADGAFSNTDIYIDQLHLKPAGYATIYPTINAGINSLG